MTPHWDSPYATRLREELVRVADQSPSATEELSRERPARVERTRAALVTTIVVALLLPAVVLALIGRHGAGPVGGGHLAVATGNVGTTQSSGPYRVRLAILRAQSTAGRACFFIDTPMISGGTDRTYLIFPRGYTATSGLQLVDASGKEAAAAGDSVRITAHEDKYALIGPATGCPAGPTIGVIRVERSDVPVGPVTALPPLATPTTSPMSSPPSTASACTATTTHTPAHAKTASIVDVDGDGRRDTEWAILGTGGTLRFGITTASGATVSGQEGFAGGADRSFVVGRLANGVVVAITSEHRDSPVYTFSDCALHPLAGRDLTHPNSVDSPFVIYSESGGGTGGCYHGHLGLVEHFTDSGVTTARVIDVSDDGLHATLTRRTLAVHVKLPVISCGASPVLNF